MFYIGSILLALAVVEIVMAAVLIAFWQMRMTAPGLAEMAGAMGIGSVGAILTGIGATTSDYVFAYFGLQCFVIGVLLATRSTRRIQGLRPLYILETATLFACVAGDAYFMFIDDRLSGALALNSLAYVVICSVTAHHLFTETRPGLRRGCLLLGFMFAVFAAVSLVRVVVRIFHDFPAPANAQNVSFDLIYALIGIAVSIGWSLGFLWTSYSIAEHRLRAANEKLQRFSGAVAHDLKTPLNAIIGYLDAIDYLPESAEHHKARFIATTRQAAERMNRFIDHLLEQSSHNGEDPAPAVVDTMACIKEALEPLEYKIVMAGAEVHVGDTYDVLANRFQLMRVFQNLLDNAIKYRHDERRLRIRISSWKTDGWVRISVEDNGLGIPEESRGEIFGQYTRIKETNGIPGYGLGLSECLHIVESFGGTIEVASEAGAGSTFTLKLPGPAT